MRDVVKANKIHSGGLNTISSLYEVANEYTRGSDYYASCSSYTDLIQLGTDWDLECGCRDNAGDLKFPSIDLGKWFFFFFFFGISYLATI